MYRDGIISQEEALANADSATNLLWLMNNTDPTKGTSGGAPAPKPALQQELEQAASGASFSEFRLTLGDEKAA
jgi:twitching motility protein PilU